MGALPLSSLEERPGRWRPLDRLDRSIAHDHVLDDNPAQLLASSGGGHSDCVTFEDTDPATGAPATTSISTYDADGKLLTSKDRRQVATSTLGQTQTAYDSLGRQTSVTEAQGSTPDVASTTTTAYDALDRRTKIVATTAGASPTVTTTDFRYAGDRVAAEVTGSITRDFTTDESGVIRKMVVTGGADAGTYLPVWNGHGDLTALWRVNADGSLTLAASVVYTTWGRPTVSTHNGIGDLSFRYLYVGASDVQWDNELGLGLLYMHARHYSPVLGRFLQPDPIAAEANLYAYAENSPVSRVDPSGTVSILRQLKDGGVSFPFTLGIASWIQRVQPAINRVSQAVAGAPRLPAALQSGANAQRGVSVDSGFLNNVRVYVGITNSIVRRQMEHGARFATRAMNAQGLTRGQARAIEQAIIHYNRASLQNVIDSISPENSYYREAVAWGAWWLRKNGFSRLVR